MKWLWKSKILFQGFRTCVNILVSLTTISLLFSLLLAANPNEAPTFFSWFRFIDKLSNRSDWCHWANRRLSGNARQLMSINKRHMQFVARFSKGTHQFNYSCYHHCLVEPQQLPRFEVYKNRVARLLFPTESYLLSWASFRRIKTSVLRLLIFPYSGRASLIRKEVDSLLWRMEICQCKLIVGVKVSWS